MIEHETSARPRPRSLTMPALLGLAACLAFGTSAVAQSPHDPAPSNTPAAAQNVPPTITLKAHAGAVRALAYSIDGRTLASAGAAGTVKLWSLPAGTPAGSFPAVDSSANRPAITPDSRWLIYLSEPRRIALHALAPSTSPAPDRSLDWKVDADIALMDVPPDGRTVAAAGAGTLTVWDAATGAVVSTRSPHGNSKILALACSPDGGRIATAGEDGRLVIADARTGKVTHESTPQARATRITWSPLGDSLLLGSENRQVHTLDPKTGLGYVLVELPDAASPLDYWPLGTRLSVGWNDGSVHTWARVRGAWGISPLEGGDGLITSLLYSWNGRDLAAGDVNGIVRVWPIAIEEPDWSSVAR